MITNIKQIDKHKSVLLIGIGETNKYLHDIVRPERISEAREVFGECDLVSSYELLAQDNEDKDIFMMNIELMTDYLDIAQLVSSYDFAYVVPIDVGISNFFYDPHNDGRKTFYIQYLIEALKEESDTVFLVTDTHATLYQDIDQFLQSMRYREKEFRAAIKLQHTKRQIVFVANNLNEVNYGNVELARMILLSEVNEYPIDNRRVSAVFNIDFTDDIGSMAYFKTHANGVTTVENLLNFDDEEEPTKIFFIYRICLYIAKELDFTEYIGSKYIPYKKQRVESIVSQYLDTLVGFIITGYEINEVFAKEDPLHPGTVNIILRYSIQPVGCSERFITRTLKI
jgi:hypothetical protein